MDFQYLIVAISHFITELSLSKSLKLKACEIRLRSNLQWHTLHEVTSSDTPFIQGVMKITAQTQQPALRCRYGCHCWPPPWPKHMQSNPLLTTSVCATPRLLRQTCCGTNQLLTVTITLYSSARTTLVRSDTKYSLLCRSNRVLL
jgi:hypothetical protein